MLGKRTLVKLDLEGYGDIANFVENIADATAVAKLNARIKNLVEESLKQVGFEKGEILPKAAAGDAALVSFKVADDAHQFAISIHQNIEKWNFRLAFKHYKMEFRIGCATGELDISTHDGCLNTVAYRLEPKAHPGGTLIDTQTYNELSPVFQAEYDIEEMIPGKRQEKYRVRRWLNNSKNKLGIINRILDIPQINGSQTCSFEVVTLNNKAEEVHREFQYFNYLSELIEDQEIRMMIIPGGEYGMGTSEKGCHRSEQPHHLVNVPAFLMSHFPITKAQWKVVSSFPEINRTLKKISSRGPIKSPVVNVSWYDAVEFCDRLSLKTGCIYRLPTEAEWEYACKGGSNTQFHFGETISSQYVNYNASSSYRSESPSIYRKRLSLINEFKLPNKFGLFDMHGNVWEWCLDHWHDDYQSAPSDASSWVNPDSTLRRVLRGGSWKCEAYLCRSTSRFANNESDNLSDDIGFRIVKVLSC
jgi:formylglycine-generating enzyme required for sulfatase activity